MFTVEPEPAKPLPREDARRPVAVGDVVLYRLPHRLYPPVDRDVWGLHAGDAVPMLVTRVHSPTLVNGCVFPDGNTTLFQTSVLEGNGLGQWKAKPCMC